MHTADATVYRRPGSLRVLVWFLFILFFVMVLTMVKHFLIDKFLPISNESRLPVSTLGDNAVYLLAIVLLLGIKKLWHKNLGAALRHEWGPLWPSIPRSYLIATTAIAATLIVLQLLVYRPLGAEHGILSVPLDFIKWLPGMLLMVLLVYGTLQHRWLDAPLWKNVLPVCLILFLNPLAGFLPYFITLPEDPIILNKVLREDILYAFAWTLNAGLAAALYRKTRSLSPVLAYFLIFAILTRIAGVVR